MAALSIGLELPARLIKSLLYGCFSTLRSTTTWSSSQAIVSHKASALVTTPFAAKLFALKAEPVSRRPPRKRPRVPIARHWRLERTMSWSKCGGESRLLASQWHHDFPTDSAVPRHHGLIKDEILTCGLAIDGLGAAYSMSVYLARPLSIISIALSGDPLAGKWSIGAGFPATLGLLGTPSGIVGTHNLHEEDASIVRVGSFFHTRKIEFLPTKSTGRCLNAR